VLRVPAARVEGSRAWPTHTRGTQVLAIEAWVRTYKFDMVVVFAGGGLGVTYPFDACVNYAASTALPPLPPASHCPPADHATLQGVAAAYVAQLTAAWQRLRGAAPRFNLPTGALTAHSPCTCRKKAVMCQSQLGAGSEHIHLTG
jgi:hypothetical protein